jgi:hypothetical protein
MRLSGVTAAAVAVLALLTIAAVGCGDDTDDVPRLRVDLIDTAVDALLAQNPDAVFYEVNATPDLVNLFVAAEADDGSTTATAYVYEPGGGLGEPAAPKKASGTTFAADQIDVDPDRVLDEALDQLTTSIPRVFAINGAPGPDGPAGAVTYRIVFDSVEGGSLAVSVRGDGVILGVDAE